MLSRAWWEDRRLLEVVLIGVLFGAAGAIVGAPIVGLFAALVAAAVVSR